MGRFETLNEQTQDVVTALIPSIATNFGVSNLVDSIPQDIRMRKWDCDRKEHIIDQSEDDPRNWGVQFLKDLLTISRHKMGKVDEFQSDLRMKLQKVRGLHGWVRLQDIKDLKNKYLGKEEPQVDSDSNDGGVISDEDSLASLSFGEEHRIEHPVYKKRGRPAKAVQPKIRRGHTKRRRMESPPPRHRHGSDHWERRDSTRHYREKERKSLPSSFAPDMSHGYPVNYPYGGFGDIYNNGFPPPHMNAMMHQAANPTLSRLAQLSKLKTPSPFIKGEGEDGENMENLDGLSVYELQLKLEVAEAELRAVRLRLRVQEEKRKAAAGAKQDTVEEGDSN